MQRPATEANLRYPTAFIAPFVGPRWWERDTGSPLPDSVTPAELHGRCFTHVKYALSCRQMDWLVSRAGGCCEACGGLPEESRFGVLCIDHVTKLGVWAVRGLLCTSCNSALHPGAVDLPRFRQYIQNAYYLALLAELGVTDLSPPEPPLGSVVLDRGGRPWRSEPPGREMHWEGRHWFPRHRRYPQAPETWTWLLQKFGPHGLTVNSTPN